MSEREIMEYDVIVVGAGPAGLSCAMRLKQLDEDLSVCVIEKAAEIGGHILSGAVIEPEPLDRLVEGWRDDPPPICVPATSDDFVFFDEKDLAQAADPAAAEESRQLHRLAGCDVRLAGAQGRGAGRGPVPGFRRRRSVL